jgi:hypothetical protein
MCERQQNLCLRQGNRVNTEDTNLYISLYQDIHFINQNKMNADSVRAELKNMADLTLNTGLSSLQGKQSAVHFTAMTLLRTHEIPMFLQYILGHTA